MMTIQVIYNTDYLGEGNGRGTGTITHMIMTWLLQAAAGIPSHALA